MPRRAALAVEVVALVAVLAGGGWLRLRLGHGWAYGGLDTWTYVGAAVELGDTGRYAVRLPAWFHVPARTPPLSYCRPPGYPLFLLAAAHPTLEADGPFVGRVKGVQIWLDLLTCVLIFLLARRLGGRRAAWPALILAAASPLLAIYTAALMAETLATTLTTAVVVLLAFSLEAAPRRAFWLRLAAGALVGLGMLVRPDGLLVAPCLLVPLVVGAQPWRRRLRDAAVALVACGIVFAPWPLRNLARFGELHAYGAICDRNATPMAQTRFLRWFGTWLVEEKDLPKTLWCFFRPSCFPHVEQYPPDAFGSPWERQLVARLFRRYAYFGNTPHLDRDFHHLALYRLVTNQVRTLVTLPARRAYHLWLSPHDEPLRGKKDRSLSALALALRPHLEAIARLQAALALLGLVVVLLPGRWGGRRRLALLLGVALAGRTAFMAYLGMVEGRYLVEVMPLALALGGAAVGWLVGRVRRGGTTPPA
jgi:hypothetical protein